MTGNVTLRAFVIACGILAGAAQAASVLIDVRTPEEFAAGHLEGARNISFDRIVEGATAAGLQKDDKLILYCRSGQRSHAAAQALTRAGWRDVLDYGAMEEAASRLHLSPPAQRP